MASSDTHVSKQRCCALHFEDSSAVYSDLTAFSEKTLSTAVEKGKRLSELNECVEKNSFWSSISASSGNVFPQTLLYEIHV